MKKVFCVLTFTFMIGCAFCERPKVALVLSGGGANGLAEIPLLEAIEEEGIEVDMVLGVSMGAIIGSLYASGYTPKEIRDLMMELDIVGLINQSASSVKGLPPQPANLYHSNIASVSFSKNGVGSQPGLIGDQKITNMLADCLCKTTHIKDFDALPKPFRAICTDAFSGETIICDSGSLIMAVRGSMSVPLVFSPFPTQNKSLAYDGGLSNNLPIQAAKDMGADVVIAMDVLGKIGVNQEDFGTINSSFVQSINLIISANTLSQYEGADILIRPELSAVSAALFGHVEEIINIGEKAVKEHREEIHQLALSLEKSGCTLNKKDYKRAGTYKMMADPVINSVVIEDISINESVLLPKPADFKSFVGKTLDSNAKKKLATRLEQLRYAYNLSTLTYELKSCENGFDLVILANHYVQPPDRLFVGGRPALECSYSKNDGAAFIMMPFFTAGISLKDILPVDMEFSSDRYFCGTLSFEPVFMQNNEFSLNGKITGGAKYGALHPQKILTYSTLLADDDYGFFGDVGINFKLAGSKTAGMGFLYDWTYLHKDYDYVHSLSFYAQYAESSLLNDLTGLSGKRFDAQLFAGTDFEKNFFYKGNIFYKQNFELVSERNCFGIETKAALNSYSQRLLQGYEDFGGMDGMCGYGYGSLKRNGAFAGLSFYQVLFSAFDMPILFIAKTKAGFFDSFKTFDAGASMNLALRTPAGNLIFGTGYAFVSQKWSISLGFM